MNTPSHVIVAAALRRLAPRHLVPLAPILWGSAAPDIPLFVLTAAGGVYYHAMLGWPIRRAADWMLGTLYLQNPWWLGARSTLHAPLVLAALLLVALTAGRGHRWGRWLAWFAAACGLHALLDVLTHAGDGPLLLFPLDWTTRFHSPVSYWDPRYHGRLFARLELAVDAALLLFLAAGPVARWLARRADRAVPR